MRLPVPISGTIFYEAVLCSSILLHMQIIREVALRSSEWRSPLRHRKRDKQRQGNLWLSTYFPPFTLPVARWIGHCCHKCYILPRTCLPTPCAQSEAGALISRPESWVRLCWSNAWCNFTVIERYLCSLCRIKRDRLFLQIHVWVLKLLNLRHSHYCFWTHTSLCTLYLQHSFLTLH